MKLSAIVADSDPKIEAPILSKASAASLGKPVPMPYRETKDPHKVHAASRYGYQGNWSLGIRH
jgi:hypothetical protein